MFNSGVNYMSIENIKVTTFSSEDALKKISLWASNLGFSNISIANIESSKELIYPLKKYQDWVNSEYNGDMHFLKKNLKIRQNPQKLLEGAKRAIMVSMNYLPNGTPEDWREKEIKRLADPNNATISIYARGRDYHRVMRKRLAKLGRIISAEFGKFGFRACVDSAPLLEVELAEQSGLGWRGKNTLLLNKQNGSLFFLGALLTDLPLTVSKKKISNSCGTCTACLDICPTKAFVSAYVLDARKCISYLTIEKKGIIDESLRPLIGNRIYGCDDCQLFCPWNKYANVSDLKDFDVRNGLDEITLLELFNWSEEQFFINHTGSPILRIGYENWLRNIAIALGNAVNSLKNNDSNKKPPISVIRTNLKKRLTKKYPILNHHIIWALGRCN